MGIWFERRDRPEKPSGVRRQGCLPMFLENTGFSIDFLEKGVIYLE